MGFLLNHALDESAERTPDQVAFRFLDRALSYAELARNSNRLARLLTDTGVSRGDRVGILLHKSLESPLALYGIMKAGAAYVPLDPGAPAQRLRDTLRHCGVRHLISGAQNRERIDELLTASTGLEYIIGIDDLDGHAVRAVGWDTLAAMRDDGPPVPGLTEQDLAYIMYTSGSTGAPKGIMHTHASGLSYARLSAATYDICADDRLSNHSPLHFDMSTLDYLTGPLCGATTVIIPEAYTRLPASLAKLVADERVTIWYSVPFALLQLLIRGVIEQHDMSALRWVLFGGEPFPPKHLNALRRLWPQARFSNVYGPAEVNQCTYYHLPAVVEDSDQPVPIGRVWPNAEGLIVDDRDRPVAPGEPGELLIRAPTMMRGYWNQPDLNARAFYRRAVTSDVSDVFYRTGDLVQQRDDGELMFLGRKDRQIKTRGYRVELDEVENALSAHPGVVEAAVYALPDADDNQSIEAAAILQPDPTDGLDQDALRAHCAQLLPSYAIPRSIRVLAEFPRTTSGKIDRRALRELSLSRAATEPIP